MIEDGVWIELGAEVQIKIVPTHSRQARSVLANLNEHYEKACDSSWRLLEAVQKQADPPMGRESHLARLAWGD